ncbi:MAG: hypothetical protein OXF27_00210 [Acidobacteria bacterium]|nr:hypothetical protein [Acidobacteriota bacterium]
MQRIEAHWDDELANLGAWHFLRDAGGPIITKPNVRSGASSSNQRGRARCTLMLLIVRQPDGHEMGIHADRLEVETTGNGKFRFHGPHGTFMELPARKVDYIRLVPETRPDPSKADEKT